MSYLYGDGVNVYTNFVKKEFHPVAGNYKKSPHARGRAYRDFHNHVLSSLGVKYRRKNKKPWKKSLFDLKVAGPDLPPGYQYKPIRLGPGREHKPKRVVRKRPNASWWDTHSFHNKGGPLRKHVNRPKNHPNLRKDWTAVKKKDWVIAQFDKFNRKRLAEKIGPVRVRILENLRKKKHHQQAKHLQTKWTSRWPAGDLPPRLDYWNPGRWSTANAFGMGPPLLPPIQGRGFRRKRGRCSRCHRIGHNKRSCH